MTVFFFFVTHESNLPFPRSLKKAAVILKGILNQVFFKQQDLSGCLKKTDGFKEQWRGAVLCEG